MSSTLSYAELLNMNLQDLSREADSQRMIVRKMRIEISMNTEKDSARYRREKRALARMLTALSKKSNDALSSSAKPSTVVRSKAASAAPRSAKVAAKKAKASRTSKKAS